MTKLHFGVAIAALLVAGAANAADMPLAAEPAPVLAPAERVASAFDWTGPYLGVYAGYNWNKGKISGVGGHADLDGVIVGGTAGYNVQLDSVVLGVETDFGYNDGKDSVPGASAKYDLNGTVRARAGYAFDRYLPYVTGGFAYGRGKVEVLGVGDRKWGGGWTVGGGLESAVTENISVKGEYLYSEVDRKVDGLKYNVDGHTVKAGLNYKFNWD